MSGRSAFQLFCCLKVGSKMTSNCSEATLTLAATVLRDWWICHETHRSNYINSKVCFCIRCFLFSCLFFCFVFPWKLKTHQYILQLVSVKQLVVVPPFAAVSRLKSMKDWTSVRASTSFPIKHQTYGRIREAQRETRTPACSRIGSIFLKSWFSVTLNNNWIRTLTIWTDLICLSCRKEAQCRTPFLTLCHGSTLMKDHKGTEATVYSFFQCEPFK